MPPPTRPVSGTPRPADVDPRTLLVQYLREHLRLTGTHVGCDTSQCGCCVVDVNGKAIKSCTIFAWQLEGASVTTIEGLAEPDGPLHPMQEAFRQNHGLQCGFCTGKGHYTDDINRAGQTYAFFVRSPHAHAKIRNIDSKTASGMAGVLAVLTGEHLAADKIGHLICGWMIHSKDGSPMKMASHP